MEACWAHNPEVRGSKPQATEALGFTNLWREIFVPAVKCRVNLINLLLNSVISYITFVLIFL